MNLLENKTYIHFKKLHGLGNSFIHFNAEDLPSKSLPAEFVKRICSQSYGIGSDGVMVVYKVDVQDDRAVCRVDMYNTDGSNMGMCGNGIRCVMKYLFLTDQVPNGFMEVTFSVNDRVVICSSDDSGDTVNVNMGKPTLDPKVVPISIDSEAINYPLTVSGKTFNSTCVNIGNPHCIIFDSPVPTQSELTEWGAILEVCDFFPERANIEFAEVENQNRINVKVWERGVGITSACGTGAVATHYAAFVTGRCSEEAEVVLPGGALYIRYDKNLGQSFMKGEAVYICSGQLAWD